MPTEQMLLIALCAAVAVLLVLVVVLLLRGRGARVAERLASLKEDNERLERTLRDEQRGGRQELAAAFADFRKQVEQQLGTVSGHQRERIDQFGLQLRSSLGDLGQNSDKRLAEMRATLETQIKSLQKDNQQQLERMRSTVDEKLQKTLEERLGHSFKLVSERLEAVQRGLGEMQELATGVGDLKRVLSNVKTRGTFGEVQLGALLEQILVAGQYESNVATLPGSSERVEFAIRMPGPDREGKVWLPIDAKFPREDYERLIAAQEAADSDAARIAADALEKRIRDEARKIRQKYVGPPHTTDFAVLFLPTEGLYAEIIRRPGLFEDLQRHEHVTVAGPTTLTAIINALQMGFRTLAIEQRSSEVWQLLGAVKTEFGKFGGMLESAIKQVDTVRNTLKRATGKTTTISRKLREVESLPGESAAGLLDELTDITGDEPDA
ncbi:MAG: DNA recombination protein RmuC [Rhodanobacteraceae bacterium]